MDYDELVRRCRDMGVPYMEEKCSLCPHKEDFPACNSCIADMFQNASDAIEKLMQTVDRQEKILTQFGGETGIRQAFERMGDYWRLADKYEELLKAAKKMHTWIFLHTGDEQKAYDECGLSEDMNIALGYSGQIEFRAKKPEEERGCPPDYNPGFCYGDEDCDACWEGWRKEQGG